VVVQSLDVLGSLDQTPATPPTDELPTDELPTDDLPVVESREASAHSATAPGRESRESPWWQSPVAWPMAVAALLALLLVATLARRRGRVDGRLSAEDRTRLLADVRATLEKNRVAAAGGAP
jgi:hypothetical protein